MTSQERPQRRVKTTCQNGQFSRLLLVLLWKVQKNKMCRKEFWDNNHFGSRNSTIEIWALEIPESRMSSKRHSDTLCVNVKIFQLGPFRINPLENPLRFRWESRAVNIVLDFSTDSEQWPFSPKYTFYLSDKAGKRILSITDRILQAKYHS